MALRDTRSELSSIATGAYLDILPTGTEEWAIHNIYHEAEVSLCWYDGTNNLVFDSDTAAGAYACLDFHCTAAHRIRVRNDNAGTKLIGYDGVLTHV